MEAHASECARCQALLANIVQAAPDLFPSASQESWWRGLGLRWLVPLAAGAAAVIIWVAVPNNQRPDLPEQASAQLESGSPAPPQPQAGTDRFNAPAGAIEQPADASGTTAARAEDKAPGFGGAEREQPKDNAQSQGQQGAAGPDALGARTRAGPPADAAADALSAKALAAPPAAAAAAPQAAPNETVALSRQAFRAATLEITSPDPSVRWRIGGGGSVEHTTNGGTTWEAVPTGVSADLTAGASPSRLVCWLVGRAGTVLLTTDGRTWRRVPFPEMTDLTAVRAADAQTATITTADGQRFQTTDGGLIWN
jgi:hypothetical protein